MAIRRLTFYLLDDPQFTLLCFPSIASVKSRMAWEDCKEKDIKIWRIKITLLPRIDIDARILNESEYA